MSNAKHPERMNSRETGCSRKQVSIRVHAILSLGYDQGIIDLRGDVGGVVVVDTIGLNVFDMLGS